MTRVWMITGCSAGFGRELVLAALAAGDRVMATARDPKSLDALRDGPDGERLRTTALDVTDPDAVRAAVEATVAAFGRIDVVVNNAGHGSVGAVEELTMDELRALMEVMFFGAVAVTKAALPHLRAGGGTVVQISSMGGQVTMPGFGAYCAAKFALEALSESLAAEVEPLGVRVLIVEPGAFRTEFGGARMHRSTPMDAYRGTVGPTRAAVDGMDGTQPGDPARAAAAILHVLDQPDPPLRLALGSDAVEAIHAQHTRLAADLDRWDTLSRSTDLSRSTT